MRISTKILCVFSILLTVFLLTRFATLTFQQSTAVLIITLFIASTFFFWNLRLAFGFLGVSFLLGAKVIDLEHFLAYANLEIILFLIGMMIIVGYLEKNHFFEYLIGTIIEKIGKRGKLLVFVLLCLAGVSAALIDEVTSILIMTAIVLHLTAKYNVNPIPFVLMTIFATNIGSSATVVGNPVGVMVALSGGLSFVDFLRWATPIACIALLVAIGILFLYFRREIAEFDARIRSDMKPTLEPSLRMRKNLLPSALLFGSVLLGLTLHKVIEHALGLEKNTMLLGIVLLCAGCALLLARSEAPFLVERRVDWWTLVFFMFLFSSVGALEYTGLIEIFSTHIGGILGENVILGVSLILFLTGAISVALDNVLAVAIMIPVVQKLSATFVPSTPLWWALLFGATFFGNLLFIGSTANIVALGMLEKRRIGPIRFFDWLKPGALVTIATALVALGLLLVQLPFMR